jgi:hypothetical protein
MLVTDTEYKVEIVQADSDHPLAKYVEGGREIFIVNQTTKKFYPAREFFYMVDTTNLVIYEKGPF